MATHSTAATQYNKTRLTLVEVTLSPSLLSNSIPAEADNLSPPSS
jgi:hypothetical protein